MVADTLMCFTSDAKTETLSVSEYSLHSFEDGHERRKAERVLTVRRIAATQLQQSPLKIHGTLRPIIHPKMIHPKGRAFDQDNGAGFIAATVDDADNIALDGRRFICNALRRATHR